ncbi:MAG: redoxin domain-containing protein [Bryobacteraceae bacterium]
MKDSTSVPWMSIMLRLAAIQNLGFAVFVLFAPLAIFDWLGLPTPLYPEIWQCVGMLVGVLGVGFALAAVDPIRHWAVVFIGLLAKVAGVLGFALAAMRGRAPWELVWVAAVTDIIWWLPFSMILAAAYGAYLGRLRSLAPEVMRFAFRTKTEDGITLEQLSRHSPVLLVFLRHAGCTFCREALADLARQRKQVEQSGVQIALVHMGSSAEGGRLSLKYGLDDLPRISDPNRTLYRAFAEPLTYN